MDGRKDYRVKMDSVGTKDVPENVYYGIQSMRAVENFQITGLDMHPEIISSLAYTKEAAAVTNCEIGLLEKRTAEVIVQAYDKTLEGRFHEGFIVDPIQDEVGTSLSMDANEVIANRATEIPDGQRGDCLIVSPNDRVNCGQSIDDVIPTAGRMTSLRLLRDLRSELMRPHREFSHKAEKLGHVIKIGHTQTQDAMLIRLGQELKAYLVAVMWDIRRMDEVMEEMCTLNTGGTAVGIGIDADEVYLRGVAPNLAEVSNMEFMQALDLTDTTQNLDSFVTVSGTIKACVVTLSKTANNLRLMSSGLKAGSDETNLPVRQNGSSIMPGKVNPVIPGVMNQVAFNIIRNDLIIIVTAEAGQLELNVFESIIFYCMFQSTDTLAYAIRTLMDNCVSGIMVNEERCRSLVESSIGVITVLSPHVGYEKAADISKKALQIGMSVRSIILQKGLLDEEELDHTPNPVRMTELRIPGKELLMKNNIDEEQYGTK